MMAARHTLNALVLFLVVSAGTGCLTSGTAAAEPERGPAVREAAFSPRPFSFPEADDGIGRGVAYGPHRDGQRPGGPSPTRAQLLEDLHLMAPHWSILRVYSAAEFSGTLLELIRRERLDLRVMLGVWIAPEETRDSTGAVIERFPENRDANHREVDAAIRLAEAYPEIVAAISVGNETQVFWSAHRSPADILIGYLREIRARTRVPVTTADDFNFWNKPESGAVAREVDFIAVHMHPLWNGLQLEEAVDWIRETYAAIRAAHPGTPVVIAETGWATRRHTEGEQAKLMKGRTGEAEQAVFFRAFNRWVGTEEIPAFIFEAFDENWKGGEHEDEVEKHWGLFRADRTAKPAMAGEE